MCDEEVQPSFKLEDLTSFELVCFKSKLLKRLSKGKKNKYGILHIAMYEDYEDKNRTLNFLLSVRNPQLQTYIENLKRYKGGHWYSRHNHLLKNVCLHDNTWVNYIHSDNTVT